MSSEIKVSSVKAKDGTAGISIADSTGNVTASGTLTATGALTASGGIANAGTISAGTLGSSVVFPAGGTGNAVSVAVIADEKAYNESGGPTTTGSFLTRDLNTVIKDDDSIVTIESTTHTVSGHTSRYKFTLGAGTYQINWSCPAMRSDRHVSQLWNETGTSVLQMGTAEYCQDGDAVQTRSIGSCVHTISSNNTYQVRQRFDDAQATDGFGVAHNYSGHNNVYTIVWIYKFK